MGGIAVLGGAGGLGSAITRRLASRTPVTIGYRSSEDQAQALRDEIRSAGGEAEMAAVDLTDFASVEKFLAAADERWDGLDGVVQASGPAIPLCPLADVSHEDFRRIYETDVFGSFNLLRAAVSQLRETGGSVVLLLTTAVLRTLENDGMSGGPKTAVAGLLRQTAREAGPYGIRVNGVAPGVIDAGIVLTSFEVDEVAKSVIESCLAQTPMGRMGAPEDIAAMVDFLSSDQAGYVSGQIVAVDGGYSA